MTNFEKNVIIISDDEEEMGYNKIARYSSTSIHYAAFGNAENPIDVDQNITSEKETLDEYTQQTSLKTKNNPVMTEADDVNQPEKKRKTISAEEFVDKHNNMEINIRVDQDAETVLEEDNTYQNIDENRDLSLTMVTDEKETSLDREEKETETNDVDTRTNDIVKEDIITQEELVIIQREIIRNNKPTILLNIRKTPRKVAFNSIDRAQPKPTSIHHVTPNTLYIDNMPYEESQTALVEKEENAGKDRVLEKTSENMSRSVETEIDYTIIKNIGNIKNPVFRLDRIRLWVEDIRKHLEIHHDVEDIESNTYVSNEGYTRVVRIDIGRLNNILDNMPKIGIYPTEEEKRYVLKSLVGTEGFVTIQPEYPDSWMHVVRKTSKTWGRYEHKRYLQTKGWKECHIVGTDPTEYWSYIDIVWENMEEIPFEPKLVTSISYVKDSNILLKPNHCVEPASRVHGEIDEIVFDTLSEATISDFILFGNKESTDKSKMLMKWTDIIERNVYSIDNEEESFHDAVYTFFTENKAFWTVHLPEMCGNRPITDPELYLIVKTQQHLYDFVSSLKIVKIHRINNVLVPVCEAIAYNPTYSSNLYIYLCDYYPNGSKEYKKIRFEDLISYVKIVRDKVKLQKLDARM